MDESMIRIVLMNEDPHDARRIVLRLRVSTEPSFEIRIVTELEAFFDFLPSSGADAALINFMSFNPSKVALIHRLTGQFCMVPVIVLAPARDMSFGRKLIRAGAEECLGKSEPELQRLSRTIAYAVERRKRREVFRELSDRSVEDLQKSGLTRFLTGLRKSWVHSAAGISPKFLALAAHELITPLTAIQGYLSLLLSGQVGDLSPSQKEFLAPMKQATHHLTRLAGNLLDLSKIELGESSMHLKPSDLRMLVEEELAVLRSQAQNKEILLDEWVEDSLPLVLCDRHRIKEVIDNLISNAVKYTPRKGRVHIGIRRAASGVQLDVADTGIGIRESDLNKVFEPFQHLHKAGLEGEPSTGLGLALVKRIIEAHGGQVAVKSREGAGSTFSVVLPTYAPPAHEKLEDAHP